MLQKIKYLVRINHKKGVFKDTNFDINMIKKPLILSRKRLVVVNFWRFKIIFMRR